MPMQRRMEMGILSQVGRLPGLPSSHLGLNTVLGRDETIDWEDYLGCALRPRPHCCSTASPHSPAARPPHLSRRRDSSPARGGEEWTREGEGCRPPLSPPASQCPRTRRLPWTCARSSSANTASRRRAPPSAPPLSVRGAGGGRAAPLPSAPTPLLPALSRRSAGQAAAGGRAARGRGAAQGPLLSAALISSPCWAWPFHPPAPHPFRAFGL